MRGTGTLVIVESPAKAKTIKKYLGAGYVVKASVGHVKDLPKKKMGIDIEHDFQPEYVVIEGKKKVLDEITAAAKIAGRVLLAPDPDREGEAIAWHLAEEVRPSNPNIFRVLFNEITKKAITESISATDGARRSQVRVAAGAPDPGSPGRLPDQPGAVDEGQARACPPGACSRSPCAWSSSARPRSRRSCRSSTGPSRRRSRGATRRRSSPRSSSSTATRSSCTTRDRRGPSSMRWRARRRKWRQSSARSVARTPPPPFITSKLQQEASSKLRFSPKRTMGLAQRLYEGVEVGDEGPVGLITYMRTDSTRISDDALAEVRAYIAEHYGAASLPAQPVVYKTKKRAQDAHEAIRPTSMKYDPEDGAPAVGRRQGRRARRARDRRSAEALHADLEPLRRLPDGAGGLRSDQHRHRGRARRACAPPARS